MTLPADDTPERSDCAVCQGSRRVLVDDDAEVPCPHCEGDQP